jgi:hypothetical protein
MDVDGGANGCSADTPDQSEIQNIIDNLSPEESNRLDKLRNIGIAVWGSLSGKINRD